LRVAKPGAHLVAFGGTRTYHRLAVAIEDAGWEIRDCLGWLYGSGFPKSLDVSKAIDKAAGVRGEAVGERRFGTTSTGQGSGWNDNAVAATGRQDVFAPASDESAKWSGYGTALKPAWEPIILARKPLGSTVAECVQTHGTGALNIDGCRVEGVADSPGTTPPSSGERGSMSGDLPRQDYTPNAQGRWPANIVHDGSDEVLAVFPQTSGKGHTPSARGAGGLSTSGHAGQEGIDERDLGAGSTARFFYCAKASRSEREAGLDEFEPRRESDGQTPDGVGGENPRNRTNDAHKNHHPTVKPVALMRWLVRLVTPSGGIVLDPFMGSGTTGVAAAREGFEFVGIDMEAEYLAIAQARIAAVAPPLF
jgi:site-specific DNA-methyltransferase (adenine-specific)